MIASHRSYVTIPASLVLAASLALMACRASADGPDPQPRPITHDGGASSQAPDPGDFVSLGGGDGLTTFRSEAQLRRYVAAVERRQRLQQRRFRMKSADGQAEAASAAPEDSDADDGESITNTQEAGVDEGGIVKAHGEYLIVLRRGRLLSMRLGEEHLQPISTVDVTPPGEPDHYGWYDEMLIHDRTIVVVGYSYQASATELALFDLDEEGRISYRATHLLSSADYYSSRNYASRLVGDQLIFYMPYPLMRGGAIAMPGVRRHGSSDDDWNTIVGATEIYRPIQDTEWPILHTVVRCDLSQRQPDLSCTAQGVIGPYGRTFYVSRDAVYVWVSGGMRKTRGERSDAVVYRMPLDGSAPGALEVWGAPVDQFSLREGDDGFLNVLVRAEGGGDWMWSPETSAGDVALLRVPVAGISAQGGVVKPEAYTALPTPSGWSFQNRFVGDHVLYGTGSSWGYAEPDRDQRVFVYPVRGGDATALELPHGVDRLEALGADAVVVGTDGENLHFTSIDLGERPRIAGRFVQARAAQGELRSHGFFFRQTARGAGMLGLPIRSAAEPGYAHLVHGSARILFLEVDDLAFSELGSLASGPEQIDDGCKVSCVDWYGNARPIFYRGRIFALLGYELVEGRVEDGSLRELARASFLPRPSRIAR
jgi:hypothetical protein